MITFGFSAHTRGIRMYWIRTCIAFDAQIRVLMDFVSAMKMFSSGYKNKH